MILHFTVPAAVAALFFRSAWLSACLIMLSAMVIDIDHLLATPVYDPQRCSIGYHPLHGPLPALLYLFLCCFPKTRLVGIGLLIHLALDGLDCLI